MNDVIYAVVLGVVQGLTEFLPVSSSAHLIVVSSFVNGEALPLALNVALHVGTLSALLIYFWRDWLALAKGVFLRVARGEKNFESDVMLPALIVGTIPAGVVGVLWENDIEAAFHNPAFVALPLAVVGILIWWGDRQAPVTKDVRQLTIRDGLLVGLAQACALIPGVSRSGATILGARLRGYDRSSAARFSFLLGTPAMVGAALLESKNILASVGEPVFFVGALTALIVGCLAIKFLMRFLRTNGFGSFAAYRLAVALMIVFMV